MKYMPVPARAKHGAAILEFLIENLSDTQTFEQPTNRKPTAQFEY